MSRRAGSEVILRRPPCFNNWFKAFTLVVVLLLGACASQIAAQRQKEASEAISSCSTTFPISQKRNAYDRSKCLVEAENRIYRSSYPYPDLFDLKHAYRLALARKIDSEEITSDAARLQLAEVNTKVQSIFESRRNARVYADSRASEAQAASTQALFSGLSLLQATSRPPVINTSCNRLGNFVNCQTY